MDRLGVRTNLVSRYMDDGRSILHPLKPGWRWDGQTQTLKFNLRWEKEDQELSSSEITRRGLHGTLNIIEEFLEFTMELEEDFEDSWLPTLDTSLKMGEDNKVLFKFYEKPTSSNVTVQKRTAMGEDQKVQIVSNDLVSEDLGKASKVKMVDDYAQKLSNSGYKGEQVRKIICNGIKRYEGRRRKCLREGRMLHRTSTDSQGARIRKKLLAKSNWFRKKRKSNKEEKPKRSKDKSQEWGAVNYNKELEVRSVLFVEQTPGGELSKRLREQLRGMEDTLGFKVRVAERTGRSLGSSFSQSSLWEGTKCGREDCTTCEQGAEELPNCTRKSIVYENICSVCNPGATKEGELVDVKEGAPSVYVGESSRSIFERSREHWEGARRGATGNHMVKHQMLEHGGGGTAPKFIMKVVSHHKTALARQVSEAVRIRRRGGDLHLKL